MKKLFRFLLCLLCLGLVIGIALFFYRENVFTNKLDNIKGNPYLKLENLGNKDFKKIKKYFKLFKKENLERYIAYQKNNSNFSLDKIILNVNMGLDKPFYENTKIIKNTNRIDVLVNKYNLLPDDYKPNDLEKLPSSYGYGEHYMRSEAKKAFIDLVNHAQSEGYVIKASSTFRTKNYQRGLYNSYARQDGYKGADRYSARPRSSEHETGLSVDVASTNYQITKFKNTKAYTWMTNNCYKYGFILRYPEGKENITGYMFESWHYRYLGKELALKVYNSHLTYDEYYALYLDRN